MSWFHRPCAACAAQQQTITVLADQIDWLREQLQNASRTGQFAAPDSAYPRLTVAEDEEDVLHDLREGRIDPVAAEEVLAQIQAANQTVELVRAQ